MYQGDLDDIEMYFMAAVKEIKKGIGSHYAEQEAMSKKVAEKMFTELTKGQDVQHPTITAEQLTDAMLDLSLIHIFEVYHPPLLAFPHQKSTSVEVFPHEVPELPVRSVAPPPMPS